MFLLHIVLIYYAYHHSSERHSSNLKLCRIKCMWSGIPVALEFLRELRYSFPFSHSSCFCSPSLLALSSLVCALAGFGLGCICTALFTVPGLRRCCLQCFRLGYIAAAELAPQPAPQGLALRARFREYQRA